MAADALPLVLRLALASSVAIAFLLLARRAIRHRMGASVAYEAWLLVPAMMLVVLLPPLPAAATASVTVLVNLPAGAAASAYLPQAAGALPASLLVAWAAGAVLMALFLVREQRRFVRSLGALTPVGATFEAASRREGPVLLGLWRPRLVLPADFTRRFSAQEQSLVIAHEQAHAARRDPAANALAACLQVCFWFNPLVHIALPRFRQDQELACDAAVMREHPGAAKAYASAMLKSQLDDASAPAGCHWQSNHPLKERIMNLQHTTPARFAGRLAIATLVLAAGLGTVLARADSTPPAKKGAKYDIDMTLTTLGGTSKPRLHIREGEPFKISKGNDKDTWTGAFVLSKMGDGSVKVSAKLTLNDKPMGEPVMQMAPGEEASIRISGDEPKNDFELSMVVKPLAETVPAK